jgi:hypothetical protein
VGAAIAVGWWIGLRPEICKSFDAMLVRFGFNLCPNKDVLVKESGMVGFAPAIRRTGNSVRAFT